MKTEKLILLFTKLKSLLSEDKIDEAFTVLNKMKLFFFFKVSILLLYMHYGRKEKKSCW